MKKHLLIVALLAVLCACTPREQRNMSPRETLSRAEALMTQAPDSALMLLEDLSKGALRGRENRAHFALLYSQALDKNYIDRSNDSIIRVAVDYYSTRKKEPEKLFLSYYYLGRVQQNAGNLTRAMLSYGQAEELVAEIQDDYAIGLLYAQMGNLYKAVYDLPKSLDCFQKAYTHYEKADKELHKMYAKRDVGVLLMDLKKYSQAETYLLETLQWADENDEHVLLQDCIDCLFLLYIKTEESEKYSSLYNKYKDSITDEFILLTSSVEISLYNDKQLEAEQYLKRAWRIADDALDTTYLRYKELDVHKSFGNYQKAVSNLEAILSAKDRIVRNALQQPLLSAQRDYFKSQSELNELKLQHNKQKQLFAFIVLLMMIAGLFVFIRQRMKAKEQEINYYVEKVKDLEKDLSTKDHRLHVVSQNQSQMSEQVNQLFAKQYGLINQLSVTCYEMHATRNEKEAVYKRVKKEIECFSSNKETLQELENIVNQHKNNVMAVFREEFPEFSEMDFRLICYSIAGFSAKAISVFTGNSTTNIYTRKSRLKAIIADSDYINKEELLKYLLK
ncbi:MAG: deoxyribodipyrimidine photo-lyase [Bacteroidales bacterium]|nr:deoxyribodipyrimidine photo-lyase [Bacteroidales bacterium]